MKFTSISAALEIAAGAPHGRVSRTDMVNALATLADEVLAFNKEPCGYLVDGQFYVTPGLNGIGTPLFSRCAQGHAEVRSRLQVR